MLYSNDSDIKLSLKRKKIFYESPWTKKMARFSFFLLSTKVAICPRNWMLNMVNYIISTSLWNMVYFFCTVDPWTGLSQGELGCWGLSPSIAFFTSQEETFHLQLPKEQANLLQNRNRKIVYNTKCLNHRSVKLNIDSINMSLKYSLVFGESWKGGQQVPGGCQELEKNTPGSSITPSKTSIHLPDHLWYAVVRLYWDWGTDTLMGNPGSLSLTAWFSDTQGTEVHIFHAKADLPSRASQCSSVPTWQTLPHPKFCSPKAALPPRDPV